MHVTYMSMLPTCHVYYLHEVCQSCTNLVHGIVLQEQAWIWAIHNVVPRIDAQVLEKKQCSLGDVPGICERTVRYRSSSLTILLGISLTRIHWSRLRSDRWSPQSPAGDSSSPGATSDDRTRDPSQSHFSSIASTSEINQSINILSSYH